MDDAGGRLVGGRGGSLAGRILPRSLAGKLAVAAAFCGLLWMEPDLWVVPAAMLLGAVMCVFRIRGQPLVEALVMAVGGAVLYQLTGAVVAMLAALLAATFSSLLEAPVLRLLRTRGWLGAVRMRELRAESAGDGDRAGGGDGERPLRFREVPGKYRWFGFGMSIGVMLMLVMGLALFSSYRPTRRAPSPSVSRALSAAPVPSLNPVADLEWRLRSRDGQEVSLSELRGKVLFVNRWATWCKPCVAEMPGIEELTREASLADVAWLPISEEPLPVVLDFAREQGWDLPLYAAENDTPAPFEGPSIPATFIVDREGRIVFRHVGAADWNTPATVDFLTSLLDD